MEEDSESWKQVCSESHVFRNFTTGELFKGVQWSKVEQSDFELDNLYPSDEGSDDDDEMWKLGSEVEKRKPVNLHLPPLLQGLTDECENVTSDGGVKKLILQKGTGIVPPAGSKLIFHYVGFVLDESSNVEKFDSSTDKRCLRAIVDDDTCDLIRGLKIGLKSMELVEVAHIIIQPDYGFGPLGCPPRIPAGCQLIFNVRLKDCIRPEQLCDPVFMTPLELKSSELDFREVYIAAKRVRHSANLEFRKNNFGKAVRGYRHAIDLLENFWKVTDEQAKERSDLLACCYTNKALAYVSLKKGPQACNACKAGLNETSRKYKDKLYLAFSRAKLLVDSYSEARLMLKRARDVGADQEKCDKVDKQILETQQRTKAVETKMAKLMLGIK